MIDLVVSVIFCRTVTCHLSIDSRVCRCAKLQRLVHRCLELGTIVNSQTQPFRERYGTGTLTELHTLF